MTTKRKAHAPQMVDEPADPLATVEAAVVNLERLRKDQPAMFFSHPGRPDRAGQGHVSTVELLGRLKGFVARLEAIK